MIPGLDLLAIGKWDNGRPVPEIEHLTCFAGAMLGLGAKLLDRPEDMVDAETFTKSCYWLSATTPTGLQPESVEFFDSAASGLAYINISLESGEIHHPHTDSVDLEVEIQENKVQKDGNGVYHWRDDWSEVDPEVGVRTREPQAYYQKIKGVPVGTRSVNGRGINRPETIESIFYMYVPHFCLFSWRVMNAADGRRYRLTGDPKWQDRGWKMFVSWMETSKVHGGISSVLDVTKEQVMYGDNMESFAFAETFK